jgi:hypothetical protein
MRKSISVLALILALSCSTSAGEIQNGITGTPPQPTPAVQEPTTDGIMQNDASDGHIQNEAAATFAQVLLNLLALS